MADKSNWYDFLIPSDDTRKAIEENLEEGQLYNRIIGEEGIDGLLIRLREEELLNEGLSEEDVKKRVSEENKYTKLSSLLPKDVSLFGEAQAAQTEAKKESTDIDEPVKYKEVEKVGLGDKDDYEVGLGESLTGAVVSGAIKIPKGIVNFGTLIYDAATGDGIDVDKSLTERFNREFEKTIFGLIENQAEDQARATAAGHLTEAFVQLMGGYKIAMKATGKTIEYASMKARQLAPILVNAVKTNRYGKTVDNVNLTKAASKAKQLNKPNGFDKFAAITIGGGFGGGAIVMKAEDIGTIGDIEALDFIGTGLDREKKETANEDAFRQLNNKFKFGAELAFPIIPFVYGTGKVAKLLANKGKDLAFSNSAMERWVDKFVGKPFRSRSDKAQQIFDGIQKLEGKKSAVKVLADDISKDVSQSVKKISKNSSGASEALQDPNTLSKLFANFLLSTDDVVKKSNIVFPGFDAKSLNAFKKAMNDLGVNKNSIDDLITDGINFRNTTAMLKNTIAKNKNVNVATKELNQILNDRVKNNLGTDYKIFDMNTGLIDGFKPTHAAKQDVAKIVQKYHKMNGEKNFSIDDAMIVVNNILKRVTKNPLSNTPEFPIGTANILDDKAVQIVNIGDNITAGGKFKATKDGGLIQTKSDLAAFNTLFGSYKDAKNVIFNTMGDLGEIVARDNFYTNLLKESDIALAKGERPLFYRTYNEALKNLPFNQISKPLKLTTRLSDKVYTSPLDGMFTTKSWADAIKMGDAFDTNGIYKSLAYRSLMLLPKGISQAAKTILGPFTHIRNFFSAIFTTVHSGNILINPLKLAEFAKTAFNTIQPQLLYRNTPQNQKLYRFLLEEGVVNQNIIARDVEGVLGDITRAGMSNETAEVFFNKLINSTTKKFKKLYNVATDAYTAEDDIFRIINFLAEGHKLKEAYKSAIAAGMKNADGTFVKMPNDLTLMKEAAKVVRETVPNYAYVSDFVKGIRRSPLGSFASFPSEIFRTGGNTTIRAIKEIKDPIRETIGMRRLVGQALTYATFPLVAMKAGSALYGIGREKLAAMREILPTWSEDNTIIGVYENGKYKYIDFSHGFFYDTMIAPVNTVVVKVDQAKRQDEDGPLVEGLLTGITKAMGKVLEPFVSESIWLQAVADVTLRNGVKQNGSPVWNEQDSKMTRWYKATKHVTYMLSPGSLPQVQRLIGSLKGETQKGTQYEIPDELLGFLGFRKVPLDLEKALQFKIADFQKAKLGEAKKIFEGLRTGDPVTDPNQVIRQYFEANKSYYEDMSKLRRVYDALKTLGMRDGKIEEIFNIRREGPLYGDIENNKFFPILISQGQVQGIEDLAKDKKIPNILNERVMRKIEKMEQDMERLKLNKDFDLDINKYLLQNVNTSELQTPPLPKEVTETAVNPNVINSGQVAQLNNGLTMAENALLSEEEKMIKLRQRGMLT